MNAGILKALLCMYLSLSIHSFVFGTVFNGAVAKTLANGLVGAGSNPERVFKKSSGSM